MIYGTGCKPSKIDGTEHIFKANIALPAKFSLKKIMPPILNQGATSKCVAYSLTSYLDWKRNTCENDNNGGQFNIDELYEQRQNRKKDGMAIKDALSILRHRGNNGYRIHGYAKVNSMMHLKMALMLNGPCACALPVKSYNSDFWNGDETKGYHCVLIVGYNNNVFEIRNSWGKNWGTGGYTNIHENELNKCALEIWTILD